MGFMRFHFYLYGVQEIDLKMEKSLCSQKLENIARGIANKVLTQNDVYTKRKSSTKAERNVDAQKNIPRDTQKDTQSDTDIQFENTKLNFVN